MSQAPRTMTILGLKFLGALAAQKTNGVYLELGPLFGSSTNMINNNRTDDAPIHTIDTFDSAPWVRRRFGIDLSRELFDKFTSQIDNMKVHQGFAPDIVKDTWSDKIGFYFDDATHGNPGWTDNFQFFSQFFNEETIICGDDFAGGWPDIVKNVYAHADEWDVKLYVMGRVWAMARKKENRIIAAVNAACPTLKDSIITSTHNDGQRSNVAACWTWGLHQNNPLKSFNIDPADQFSGQIVTFKDDSVKEVVEIGEKDIDLKDVNKIHFKFNKKLSAQFCIMSEAGKTENTKAYKSGQMIEIPKGSQITALRLSDT